MVIYILDLSLGLFSWALQLELFGCWKTKFTILNLWWICSSCGCLCLLNLVLKIKLKYMYQYYGNYFHIEDACAFWAFLLGFVGEAKFQLDLGTSTILSLTWFQTLPWCLDLFLLCQTGEKSGSNFLHCALGFGFAFLVDKHFLSVGFSVLNFLVGCMKLSSSPQGCIWSLKLSVSFVYQPGTSCHGWFHSISSCSHCIKLQLRTVLCHRWFVDGVWSKPVLLMLL